MARQATRASYGVAVRNARQAGGERQRNKAV
jgi:hypothetical protein